MSDLVETMAYRKECAADIPWHGKGNPVSNDMTPEEMRDAAGLTWELLKAPCFATMPDGRTVALPHRYSLCRSTDGQFYDVVSDLYQPVQPERALAFFRDFVSAGDMKMETAGSLENGKRIWALASIQEGFTLRGGDRVEGYLLLCSPNVAGKCLEIKFTQVRVVCHNTLTAAMYGKSGFRMAHWNKFDDAMQAKAREALGIARKQLNLAADTARVLTHARAAEDKVMTYVAQLVQPDLLESVLHVSAAQSDPSASALDRILAQSASAERRIRPDDFDRAGKMILESIIDSPGAELSSARGTWWGALNGVTHAVDHKLGRADTRLAQSWFGHREKLKTRAVDLAVQYATASAN